MNTTAMDELLQRICTDASVAAEARQLRVQLAAAAPALLDQCDAAVSEVRRAFEVSGGRYVAPSELPHWLRLQVIDTLLAFLAGTATTCVHDPDAQHPRPIFAAAWKPGLIICAACGHLLQTHGDADRTCDLCGHVGDAIWPVSLGLGPLSYFAGLCGDCKLALEADR